MVNYHDPGEKGNIEIKKFFRDADSRSGTSLGYLFPGSQERGVVRAEQIIDKMDEVGIEIGVPSVAQDEPDHALKVIKKYRDRFLCVRCGLIHPNAL